MHQTLLKLDNSVVTKLGVVLLVLAASAVLGLKASPKWLILAGILIGGLIGYLSLLRRPIFAIILLIPISFFAPWEVGTGTSVSFNLTFLFAIAIIGIWILRVILNREYIQPQTSSVNILSILFIVITCISLVAGQIRWVIQAHDQASITAQIGGWLLYVISISLMLYVRAHLKEIRWLKILTWLFIILGSIYIVHIISPGDLDLRFHLFTSRSTEAMFWIWLPALSIGQVLFNKELHPRYKVALVLLTIAIVVAGLSTGRRDWKSGWLPPLIAIGVILWLRSWRLGLPATLMAIIVYVVSKSGIVASVMTTSEQYSLDSRMATYPIMFELIKANPIIGLGFANYSHYTSLYPIWGYYVSFNSHNNYMDIIAQTGFLGLVIFLCLMIAIGSLGWKLRKLKLDGFSSGYASACLGGLVAMLASGMLGDWFLPYLYNIGIPGFRSSVFAWIFLGGLLALKCIVNKQGKENPSETSLNLLSG